MGKITEKTVKAIFETSTHQGQAIEDLYRLLYPDYNRIKHIDGHPRVGKELSKLIWEEFIAFDKKHHPGVINGGAWMNWGFSTDESLDPWEYSTEGVKVEYET